MGVTFTKVFALISLIEREPLRFGPPMSLPREAIGDDVPGLLPRGRMELMQADIGELDAMFGSRGRFPAVHVATGRVGLA